MKNRDGITLIVLVITIIVLFILAGISINIVIGQNGMITKAEQTRNKQEIEEIKQEIRVRILNKEMSESEKGKKITQDQVEAILLEYGTVNKDSEGTIKSLTTSKRGHIIPIEDIYIIKKDDETTTDRTNPNDAEIVFLGDKTQITLPITITASVTLSDNQTGVSVTQSKWVLNNSNTNIGTDASKYTGGEFSSETQDITLEMNTEGTYYLHILTVDKAKNKIETVKGPITISAVYHTHTGDSSNGGGCYGQENYKTQTYNILCGKSGTKTAWNTWVCTEGHVSTNNVDKGYDQYPVPSSCGAVIGTGTKKVITGYSMNCGKQETDIENYNVEY